MNSEKEKIDNEVKLLELEKRKSLIKKELYLLNSGKKDINKVTDYQIWCTGLSEEKEVFKMFLNSKKVEKFLATKNMIFDSVFCDFEKLYNLNYQNMETKLSSSIKQSILDNLMFYQDNSLRNVFIEKIIKSYDEEKENLTPKFKDDDSKKNKLQNIGLDILQIINENYRGIDDL